MCFIVYLAAASQQPQIQNFWLGFLIVRGRAVLKATAIVATLNCRSVPLVGTFTLKVLLGLLLRDAGTTDRVLEFRRALFGVRDDVNEIAADGVFVYLVFDLQR